jgi:translation initiation factor IF-3
MDLQKALQITQERNLDLIQVTERVEPPVCKIMDYGKYLYSLQKKERQAKTKIAGELKGIRLGFGISPHDLEIRAKLAEKFLKKGYKVRVELILRGREKALPEFAKNKINQFLEILAGILPIRVERELKREARGFTMIISKR